MYSELFCRGLNVLQNFHLTFCPILNSLAQKFKKVQKMQYYREFNSE